MGNHLICFSGKNGGKNGSNGRQSKRSRRKMAAEEELLNRQALSRAIHQHQLSQRFDGSMSRRIGSTSSRRIALSESNRKLAADFIETAETKKIVLIHGEGFGAWCWYKSISLLEESGLLPTALDLLGSGIDRNDADSISTLADYAKPLTDYLHNLPEGEKVILVGHSCGGASISYALEHYSKKISKAIFVSATMVADGQRPYDVFAEELASADVLQESQFITYGNGKDNPPTSLKLDKQQIKSLYFNQSPSKDISLATVSMRPFPLGPIMEKLSLSQENYGSTRRFFIQTLDDFALSPDIQEKLVRENPPEGVYKIKGSDHCPFFSKPQSLHKILLEIVQLP